MATSSRIGVVEDRLVELLKARPGLNGIKITVGTPPAVQPDESVHVSGQVTARHEWGSLGQHLLNETFTLHVIIIVSRTETDHGPVRDRALELFDEVEDEIFEDSTLGLGDDTWNLVPGSFEIIDEPTSDRRLVVIDLSVECSAVISR